MERNIAEKIKRQLSTNRWRRAGHWLLCGVGGLVAGCMIWALILPAITMSNDPICGLTAHTHSDACLETVNYLTSRIIDCELDDSSVDVVLHQHDGMCYEGDILICDMQEIVPHTHSVACYMEGASDIPEGSGYSSHTHSQACYEERRGQLICGQQERAEHHHNGDCYSDEQTVQSVLICNRTEDEPGVPHQHDEGCYGLEFLPVIICGKEETTGHTHTDNCFQMETVLACGYQDVDDVTAAPTTTAEEFDLEGKEPLCGLVEYIPHEHSDKCYEIRTVNGRTSNTLICGLQSVIVHQHSYRCSVHVEPGEHEVLICGLSEHIHTDACYVKLDPNPDPYLCGFTEHEHDTDCFFENGDPKCLIPEHTHTDECLDSDSAPGMKYPMNHGEYLCGKEEHFHDEGCYEDENLTCNREEHTHCAECLTSDKFSDPATKDCELKEHQHTESCRNEVGEYICGETQHTHDEDCCPSWKSSEDELQYLCGLAEHEHTADCGDACDLLEHTHTEECLYPRDVDANGLPLSMELDGLEYTIETDDYVIVFRVSGTATFSPEVPESSEEEIVLDAATSFVIEDAAPPLAALPAEENNNELTPSLQVDAADDAVDISTLKDNASGTLTEEELDELDIYQIVITDDYGRVADLSMCTMDVEFFPKNPETVAVSSPGVEADDPDSLLLTNAVAVYTDTGEAWATMNEETGTYQVSGLGVASGNAGLYSASDLEDPVFTVQYYAEIDTIALGGGTLPLIDTSGGKLPQNGGSTSSVKNASLSSLAVENGKIKTKNSMHKMFLDHAFHYLSAPGLKYVNIVTNLPDANYKLKEIWLPKRNGNGGIITDLNSTNPAHWRVMTWEGHDAPKFTNRPKTVEDHPDRYILIEPDSVVRLVYTTTSSEKVYDANFYDYDITTGRCHRAKPPADPDQYVYVETGAAFQNGKITSTFTNFAKGLSSWDGHLWVYTYKQGINSNANYLGSGTRFSFGHQNTGTGYGLNTWSNGGYSNKLNSYNSNGYGGCTFGMAESVKDGTIQFASGLNVPSLFSEKNAKGKSIYDKGQYSLEFKRVGDTYTLSGVGNTGTRNLDTLGHPTNSVTTHTSIWTNNFWPMDSAPSYSTGTHDIAFGSSATKYGKTPSIRFGPYTDTGSTSAQACTFPESDDGQYHNSYFGMNFAITFDVSQSYTGPLEYVFFGDDDMWVFLTELAEDGKTAVKPSDLIIDIGGVHSAVGEYVNLWDYIDKPADVVIDIDPSEVPVSEAVRKYRLDFFYTERGASGSTCWMQFTLPTVVSAELQRVDDEHGSLYLHKEVEGTESPQEFQFRIDFTGDPSFKEGEYHRVMDTGEIETVKFKVADGVLLNLHHDEEIFINDIPDGVKYTITELDETRYGYYTTYVVTESFEGEQISSSEEISSSVSGVIHGGVSTSVVFTNHSSYSMPHTGSESSALPYLMSGTLVCVPCLAWWYKRRDPLNRLRG